MTAEGRRQAGWLAEAVLDIVARVEIWPEETVRSALTEIRRVADEGSDPNTSGALLRICDALEGVRAEADADFARLQQQIDSVRVEAVR